MTINPTIANDEAMIAFYPSAHVATKLRIKSGIKPQDLHVTLLYLGKRDSYKVYPQQLERYVSEFAATEEAMRMWHQGYGRFDNPNEYVVWAGVGGNRLLDFRQKLVEYMGLWGVRSASEHKHYTPHMTLKYYDGKKPRSLPKYLYTGTWLQDTVSLVIGDQRTDYVLKESERDYFGF